jgi:hypothetical protein
MSTFAALGMMVALMIANALVFILMDAWIQNRSDAIVSGVIRGVPVSVRHRRYLLQTRFLIHGATLIAYLVAFVNATGAFGWTLLFPFWYLHLASVLRQAEAD